MEELRSCASQLMLNLAGAGCTAPPPTPVRRPGPPAAADHPFSSLSAHHYLDHSDVESSWSTATSASDSFSKAANIAVHDDDDDDGVDCNSLEPMHRNSTPPSRAELDELALYLMQQSLVSTPTLLASPSSRKKQGMSPCSGGRIGGGGGGGADSESTVLMSGSGLSAYSYSIDGFCEKSKTSMRRACEGEGAFYVLLTDMAGQASLAQVDNLYKQCPGVDRRCLISSGPLLRISELMEQDPGTMSWGKGGAFELSLELPLPLLTDEATEYANFRKAMPIFTNLLVKISLEVLTILSKDVCMETLTNLRDCPFKPLLYIYKFGDQEAHVARHDGDLLLSVISLGNANRHINDYGESVLVVLGSHIQAWSKGKFKAPSLFSLFNLANGEICMELDLVYNI